MITVAIIEDHDVFRDGLARSIAEDANLRVAAAVASLADYDAGADESADVDVDVVLMDLHLQERDSPIDTLCARGVAVLAMSAAATADDMLGALRAGARGYLAKDASVEEARRALNTVAGGHRYVSPTLASVLLARAADRADAEHDRVPVADREVLALIAQGEHELDIADQLAQSVEHIRERLDRACDAVRSAPGT